uniref:C2H2-type domain-containing protein n=1 Tax=Esox lucius TaxID=8010 RepID=A0A3P9AAL7_ESOLU
MFGDEIFQKQLSTIIEIMVAASVSEIGKIFDECSAAVMPLKLVQQNQESSLLKSKLQRVHRIKTRQFCSFMEMLGKTSMEKMLMLINVSMVKTEKTATVVTKPRDCLHFHNYCTVLRSEKSRWIEDDLCHQSSPVSDSNGQTNTGPKSNAELLFEFDHQEEPSDPQPSDPQPSDPDKCNGQPLNQEQTPGRIGDIQNETCGKLFSLSSSLYYHQRTTHADKAFGCHVCSKAFREIANLKRHVNVHVRKGQVTVEKAFLCGVCHKSFSRPCNLRDHMTIHTGVKRFSCRICSKSFHLSNSLKDHMTLHTGERPYVCGLCDKSYCRARQLKAHAFVHTGEKPFTCDVYGKRFHLPRSFERHKTSHTTQKPPFLM